MAGKAERKLEDREARREVDGGEVSVRLAFTVRTEVGGDNICAWTAKLDAAAVATSIGGYGASVDQRFGRVREVILVTKKKRKKERKK